MPTFDSLTDRTAAEALSTEEVASTIAWLCHPEQAMVNGQAVVVGG